VAGTQVVAVNVPDTRELVEQVRTGIGATSEGWRHRNDARDALAALAARVEELTEALRLASRLLDGEGYFDDPPDGARSVRDEVDAESSRGGGQP